MAKKNRIFSGLDQQGKKKQPGDEFVSKYYSRKGSAQRKKAMSATLKYKHSNFGDETTHAEGRKKFSILMEALPKNVADAIRNEVRDETGDFNSSGDVIEAADYLAKSYDGVRYFTKQELIDAMKELKEKHKQDLDSDFDPFEGLELF